MIRAQNKFETVARVTSFLLPVKILKIVRLYVEHTSLPNNQKHRVKKILVLLKRNGVKMYFFWLLIYVSGQIDRQTESVTGHIPLTSRYFEP